MSCCVVYDFKDFTLDERTYKLRRGRVIVHLERRVFDLLLYLVRHRTRVVSKAELFREVWSGRVVTEASLSVAMTAARRALEDDASAPAFIETHNTRGYRFIAPVVERSNGSQGSAIGVSGVPFVGRDRELRAIDQALATALCGRMRIVIVGGEAGIGKTRFVEEIAHPSQDLGFRFTLGRCPDEEGAPPYWPWTQAIRNLLGGGNATELESRAEIATALRHLLGQEAHSQPGPDTPWLGNSPQARFRMFDAVTSCFEQFARNTPLLLAIDDVHRADEASLLLLSFLANASPAVPLLVVVTYRDSTTARSPGFKQFLASLARSSNADSIRLAGLSPDNARTLIEGLTGATLDEDSLCFALQKSNGNPFFLTHLARSLALAAAEQQPLHLASLPDDLLAAVGQQIDELPLATRELLSIASAIGTDVPIPLLSIVSGFTSEQILSRLEGAIEARVVAQAIHASSFRFTHSLVRDGLYQRLRPLHRAELHKQIGNALLGLYGSDLEPHVGAVAHHYCEAASVGAADLAIEYSIRTAEAASSHFAHEQAAEHYGRALDLLELSPHADDAIRCSLLIKLGAENIRAGRRDASKAPFKRALRLAQKLGATEFLAEVALGLAPGVLAIETGVVDAALIEQLEQAIRSLQGTDLAVETFLTARLSIALHWSDDDGRISRLVEHAMDSVTRAANPAASVFARHALWFSQRGPSFSDSRLFLARDLVRDSERAGDDELELVCRLFLLSSLMEHGEVLEFDAELERYAALAQRLRQPQGLWYVTMLRGMRTLLAGRLSDAEALKDSFSVLGASVGDRNSHHSALAHSLLISFERDQLTAVLPAVNQIVENYPSVIGWRATRAWVTAQLGHTTSAQSDLDQIGRGSFATIPKRLDWPATMALLSEAAAILGDQGAAQQLYDILRPLSDRYFVVGLCVLNWGAVARNLGLLAATLGRPERAREHLAHALKLNANVGGVAWHAQTQIDLARVSISHGDDDHLGECLESIRSARETAARLELPRLEREAKELERTLQVRGAAQAPSR